MIAVADSSSEADPNAELEAAAAAEKKALPPPPTHIAFALLSKGLSTIAFRDQGFEATSPTLGGDLVFDKTDMRASTGSIMIDLPSLKITRSTAKASTGALLTWLDQAPSAPPALRERNRFAILSITRLVISKGFALEDAPLVAGSADATRTILATLQGSLFLHGRSTPAELPVKLVMHYASDSGSGDPSGLDIESRGSTGFDIALHDLKPTPFAAGRGELSLSAQGMRHPLPPPTTSRTPETRQPTP